MYAYTVVINKYLYRQGEYLNEIGAVYENIYGIDQWWIGLTDLGRKHVIFFFISISNLMCHNKRKYFYKKFALNQKM